MKPFVAVLHVARRELAARWVLVPAAIVIGALALIAIHSIDHARGDADGIVTGAWISTLVVAGIVGMSLLGEELTNSRLSFYFARPLAPGVIFGGKLVAGVALALFMQIAIITLVAIALPDLAWQGSALAARSAPVVVAERIFATVGCTVLGMAAAIVAGSKSRWYIVDIACAAVVGVVATWGVLRMANEPHTIGISVLQIGVLILVAGTAAVATGRALARGRTDRVAAHAMLSRTLWPVVVPAALIFLFATLGAL